MVCLRCGYCCKKYLVPIIKEPDKGLLDENIVIHKGDGTPCPHLLGNEPGKYSCKVHNYPWYKDTPCFAHGQFEKDENTYCRLGEYILKQKST